MKTAQVWVMALLVFLLAGCSVKGDSYEAKIDTAILTEHTKQVQAKTTAFGVAAMACTGAVPLTSTKEIPTQVTRTVDGVEITETVMVKETTNTYTPGAAESCAPNDDGCQMAGLMARMFGAQCVESVGHDGAAVAIKAPELRARGWAAFSDGLFGKWLGPNTGVIMGGLLGKWSLDSARDVMVAAGRPNINNSRNTSNTDSFNRSRTSNDGNTSTTVGDGSLVGSGQIGDNESTVVDNGSQIGDGNLAGGSIAGGSQCSGTQCQPANSQNPDNSGQPPPAGIASPSPVADGQCFGFWNAEAMAIDPDC